MKQLILTGLSAIVFCISGCAQSLPPHEELNQAITKSLDVTGFNYSSKTRVTALSIPKQGESADPGDKRLRYLGTGLDIIQGLSVNVEGAVDFKVKKSEVLYDFHYNKDNVEVSIKIPLLLDYNTQTIYVGTSIFNTILDAIYPQSLETKGKLIRININDLLQERAASSPELSKLLDVNRFSPKNMDLLNSAFKAAILKTVGKLNDSCFSELPLTEQDKKAGVKRRIQVTLGHNDSVTVVLDLVDGVSQALFQEGVISKNEYAVLLALTDRQVLDGVVDKFVLAMTFDVGVAPSGLVSQIESRLSVADKDATYRIGIENISSFDGYNSPRFSMSPELSGIVDFKEVLAAIMADKSDDQDDTQGDSDDSDMAEDGEQGGS